MLRVILAFVLLCAFVFAFDKPTHVAACKNNTISACYALAIELSTGKNAENQDSMEEGMAYMKKACVFGEKKACDKIGANYFKIKGYRAARPYLVESCDRGIKSACESVGVIYRDGHDVRQDDVQARKFFEKACDLKSGDACFNVAMMYRGGFGVTKSRTQEKLFYKKACDAALIAGCDRFTELDNEDKGIKTGIWNAIKKWFH